MKAYDLISYLEEHYPAKAAEEWDNVGLLVGDDEKEISHIFLALDLTEEVLDEAVEAGADMIVTHHPMIFSGIKKINNHTFVGRKILSLIRQDIPYYAMHTNYDVLGMAELSAGYLKLADTKVLSVTEQDEDGVQGFGRVGKLPGRMTLRECAEFVKEAYCLGDVKVYGDLEAEVETAAVCTGSGKSMIDEAIAAGAQVYVTGDIDHHTGIDTVARGLFLIDAGHYGTEYIFMGAMQTELKKAFPALKVSCAQVKSPYTIL
ncbi:Nif3-like dinuclear metal center hexameric protein [Blautia schinkii]|nr:Nif3-like dinuclear metal center hexameric protein [Blautia schinkii]